MMETSRCSRRQGAEPRSVSGCLEPAESGLMTQVRQFFDHMATAARLTLLMVLVAASGSMACSKARAQTVPDGPPLAMPQPPPRVVVPMEEPLAAVPIATELPPAATPLPPARTPPRNRTDTAAAVPTPPAAPVTPVP